jgi:hypothetical protein
LGEVFPFRFPQVRRKMFSKILAPENETAPHKRLTRVVFETKRFGNFKVLSHASHGSSDLQ